MRAKGVVITRPEKELTGVLGEAAKQILKQKQEQARARLAQRNAIPVPNRVAYAWLYERWKANGGGRIPSCKRCDALLHWEEHHDCPGFKPKYVEHDEEWQEKQEARREAIRAARPKRVTICSDCDAEIHDLEEALWHDEHCEADQVRERRAINDDEDDLSGYEDEPEEDYCEGDDDGYDCD